MDMVRARILLYGSFPFSKMHKSPCFQQARIGHVKRWKRRKYKLWKNYQTERDSIIGTLPFGCADGYTKLLTNKTHVLINVGGADSWQYMLWWNCMVRSYWHKRQHTGWRWSCSGRKTGSKEIPVENLSFKSAGF